MHTANLLDQLAPELIPFILKNSSIQELKKCCSINNIWKDEALREIRKRLIVDCTFTCAKVTVKALIDPKSYAALIKIKQVIAGQPITRGGSQCTDACDIENHHIHTYCPGCKRNLMYGTTIHPCDICFAMDAAGLTNTPWWIEPLLVQQENNYTYLRFLQRDRKSTRL